jgi:SAM-dependent methyltransferase
MPSATRAVRELVATGPQPGGRARLGRAGSAARKGVLRLMRPYSAWQRSVNEELVAALADIDGRLARLERLRMDAHMEEFLAALDTVRGRVAQAEEELHGPPHLPRGARAVPYMAGQPLRPLEDPVAGSVLGYTGTAADAAVYRGFEEVFRGPEERVREGQRPYLDLLGDRAPVLDAGCGRGEFLDLLAERGIEAIGVDVDEGMVERCRAKGHARVERGDASSYLEGLEDGSLGAVFAAHVIEHLPYDELLRFLRLALAKLGPGGLLIAETVNPHAPHALKTFWVDPTHQHPLFPEVTLMLCRLVGFPSAFAFHPQGSGDFQADRFARDAYAVVAARGEVSASPPA